MTNSSHRIFCQCQLQQLDDHADLGILPGQQETLVERPPLNEWLGHVADRSQEGCHRPLGESQRHRAHQIRHSFRFIIRSPRNDQDASVPGTHHRRQLGRLLLVRSFRVLSHRAFFFRSYRNRVQRVEVREEAQQDRQPIPTKKRIGSPFISEFSPFS
ncbi:hypothetical protein L596_023779 [Steinernema carpocapsae]|uniref:Uncharacterized protein n=1 Tax=Steinernema carpocapsae TaxID=34508 RepID=A0A4U5MEX3_STECR|nr:hypothetical protein L596_023779 [Steinernema carpocapsae]